MGDNKKICLTGQLGLVPSVLQAAESFNVAVVTSDTGEEFVTDEYITYFIVEEFEGPCYGILNELKCRILGPTALMQLFENKEPLPPPDRHRPVYSFAMRGLTVCFTGFRKRTDLCNLARLVQLIGGSIRKEMDSKVTHLIANCPTGEKYQYASIFSIPIMAESWVTSAWENRHIADYSSKSSTVIAEHKLKFGGAHVCFLGFSPDEAKHMTEVLLSNRGVPCFADDPQCAYMVVDEASSVPVPDMSASKAAVVKGEWFWASVQNELCEDKKEYLLEDCKESTFSPDRKKYQSTPISGSSSSRTRKRKRLQQKSTVSQFESPLSHKRRSSVSDAGLLSISGSYLECTPEKNLDEVESCNESPRKMTGRRQVFLELVQTESNYVNILNTIISLFKTPLEKNTEGENVLLNATEVKLIFGNLPPIYEIHSSMLEELNWAVQNWKEDFSVGNVILKYAPELIKAYPPFINYIEKSKETLEQCDANKPRFHAFLKARQTKPECGRQSLKDLLIRPVQRLPSISLLLNDLLKQTDKQNPDQIALEQALTCIKEVMTHINEDKRKTEAQLAMFDLFNEIDNCPADLISSHRSLIFKCECVEMTDILSSKKGDILVFLLFTDTLEVCKKRTKTFKSSSLHKATKFKKQYKHVRLLPLSNLRKVIDVNESEDYRNVFALVYRSSQSLKENLCSFSIADDAVDKKEFLREMCKQMAHSLCTPDPDHFLDVMDGADINVDTGRPASMMSSHTISKALWFASRTGVKVTRALSIKRTPNITRTMSSTRPFSAQASATPSTKQLAHMRLHSCANLSELNYSSAADTPARTASVRSTRRNVASLFGVS